MHGVGLHTAHRRSTGPLVGTGAGLWPVRAPPPSESAVACGGRFRSCQWAAVGTAPRRLWASQCAGRVGQERRKEVSGGGGGDCPQIARVLVDDITRPVPAGEAFAPLDHEELCGSHHLKCCTMARGPYERGCRLLCSHTPQKKRRSDGAHSLAEVEGALGGAIAGVRLRCTAMHHSGASWEQQRGPDAVAQAAHTHRRAHFPRLHLPPRLPPTVLLLLRLPLHSRCGEGNGGEAAAHIARTQRFASRASVPRRSEETATAFVECPPHTTR